MAEEQLRIEERLEELEDNPPRYNNIIQINKMKILAMFHVCFLSYNEGYKCDVHSKT